MTRRPGLDFWLPALGIVGAFAAGLATAVLGNWLILLVAGAVVGLMAMLTWRRRDSTIQAVQLPPVTPNVILIALPTTFAVICAGTTISLSISMVATVLIAGVTLWIKRSPGNKIELSRTAWCAALPVAALAIVLRPNAPTDTFDLLFFMVGCLVAARAVHLSVSKASALVSLVDGVGLFVVVSIALWAAGLTGAAIRTEGLQNGLTGAVRAIFPLSASLAATPAMAAVYLTAVIPILIVYKRHRFLRIVAAACAVSVFILSDSRVSLLGTAAIGACVLLVPRAFRRVAPWVVGATMIMPFLYPVIQESVGRAMTAGSEYLPWLIRTNERASTLAGRDQIWSRTIDFYENQVGWVHQMIGYGTYGQGVSGASSFYSARDFRGYAGDVLLVTPHSSTLQVLLDGGWIVAGVVALTLIVMAWNLSRSGSPPSLAGLSMLVALSVVGISEVALSPSHARDQPTWWVLVVLSFIVFSREREREVPEAPTSADAHTTRDNDLIRASRITVARQPIARRFLNT